jgi:hypothetical protein
MLQFWRIDGAGHQPGETPQYFPSLAVQPFEIQADLYSTIDVFCRYGNS